MGDKTLPDYESENEIIELNRVLHNAMSQVPVGVVVTRIGERRVLVANSEFHRIMGISGSLINNTLKDAFFDIGGKCFYPDSGGINEEQFVHHLMSRNHYIAREYEAQIHQPGGKQLNVLMYSSPVLDDKKEAIAMVTIVQDITRIKQKEEAQLRKNAHLEYALSATVDGLWDWDIPEDKGFLSPRYSEIYGYEEGELPGDIKKWAQMLHPDDKSQALKRLVNIIKEKKETYQSEYRLRQKDGNYRWIRSRAIVTEKDENGVPVKMVGTHQDITREMELKQAQKRINQKLAIEVKRQTKNLETTNQQLETILNESSESIWVFDGQGIVITLNRAAEKSIGCKAQEMVGLSYQILLDRGHINESVTERVLKEKKQISMMQRLIKQHRDLLITGTPVFDDYGQISMVIVNERDLTQLNHLKRELESQRHINRRFQDELTKLNMMELKKQKIIAVSGEMREILSTALKLSELNISNILILGESGTGKGLLAKFVHNNGSRKQNPFVQINCAALPETLLEAELFGYEKGAFTGASEKGKIGLFEMAKGGTLFLDEIGELSMTVQAKLLKSLEDKEVMHLGGLKPVKIDCNIIAATNLDLEKAVKDGLFRQDLYYRLNVFTLKIVPLRRRPEDVMALSRFFLEQYNKEFDMACTFEQLELDKLRCYKFPGNVRELQNVIKKAVVMGGANTINELLNNKKLLKDGIHSPKSIPPSQSLAQRVMAVEREMLLQALETCASTRSLAAFLKTSQTSVVRKLRKHGLTHHLNRKKDD
ncbi:PAS domain S-box-containing protein [Desulfocicer vacuolatum DSM 3385]|uniref:HTH-type transcriptional regulatory protein TyrR n=2 Tax=Desulfocicer vacuolatum TaxID=2298 RepID=A0A1W2CL24_9BACT|nr:PAS domain S-box-containing protein [Desulfocicer vacuolatum DSM 3385]